MKRIALLLCLLTSACATARVTQPRPELEPGEAPQKVTRGTAWSDSTGITRGTALSDSTGITPARAVHRMALGRLPPMKLREMVLGASLDFLAHGSTPSGSGDVFCGTSTTAAAFESPAACGLATGTNYWTKATRELDGAGGQLKLTDTTDEARTIGWGATPATGTNALRYQFGDAFNGMQSGSGDRVQIYSYHGVEIRGGRASLTALTTQSGSGASDPSLIVVSSATGGGLRIDTNGGTAGTAISFSGRQTVVTPTLSPAAPIAANSCATLATPLTVSGAVVNAECATSLPSTWNTNATPYCWVTNANTVQIKFCNGTTGTVTPTAGTYSVRVLNP